MAAQVRPVSIVTVSRHRPDALQLCLTGVAQLDYGSAEVIVVACPEGVAAAEAHPLGPHLKIVPFDTANISAARNLGIAAAAGEIVAFLDDDAVPEPLWLQHLVAPFDVAEVAATGGYVIGRNGISFQWTARSVTPQATTDRIDLSGADPCVLRPQPHRAIKTEGTNMAVRRDVLAALGGFDPAFHFYLDETDLNMRLARAGHATALVPLAQVHHGFAASARRTPDRVPRNLTQIGASLVVYLRKHDDPAGREATLARHRQEQRVRLLRLLQRGGIGADDVLRLLRSFDAGQRAGQDRPLTAPAQIPRAADGFRAIPLVTNAPRRVISGRVWHRRALEAKARAAADAGDIVTLLCLSPSALYHTVRFHPDGYWLQTGGLFGRAVRTEPLIRLQSFGSRNRKEVCRVARVRGT